MSVVRCCAVKGRFRRIKAEQRLGAKSLEESLLGTVWVKSWGILEMGLTTAGHWAPDRI